MCRRAVESDADLVGFPSQPSTNLAVLPFRGKADYPSGGSPTVQMRMESEDLMLILRKRTRTIDSSLVEE